MTDTTADATDDWAHDRAARWVRARAGLEGQLVPVGDVLLAAAELMPGERVLDVGCGMGPTTRQAAAAVGLTGTVTGVDVAAEMLEVARREPLAGGSAPIDWVVADAQTWAAEGAFDVVLSRFGVMFFRDAAAAFANLSRLTAPGGRLCVAVWAERTASPLFDLPLSAAVAQLRDRGIEPEVPAADAGPFSLGDESVIGPLLRAAGWQDVAVERRRLPLPVSGGVPPAEAARSSMEFGPTRLVITGLADDQRRLVAEAIARAYEDHVDGAGHVVLPATPVIVTARRAT